MHLRLAALVVVVASCTPPPPETECVRNSDCARNRVCLDGLCVDGVTAGGSASAGGSAMGGGLAAAGGVASAGGAPGGGSAGGMVTAGGSAGGSVGGGSAGGQDAGQLDAGVDGGAGGAPDAGCQCTDLEECVVALVCVPRYALLQWRAPANGAAFPSGTNVGLEAALLLASGRTRNDPGLLPFEASGDGGRLSGVLQRVDAGLFATNVSFPVGTWAATVSLPDSGLVDGPLTFSVVNTDFSLSWAPPPPRLAGPGLQPHDPSQDAGTFFRRDETTTLVVTNASAATNVTVTVFGLTSDGGSPSLPLSAAPSCAPCTGAGFCACYPLDLSRPALEAFRGRFSFSVSGTVGGSTVTNTSQTHPTRVATLPVTRWKWAWVNGASSDGGFAVTTNAALDRRGTLYFGFSEVGASGVKALRPQGDVQLATSGLLVPTTDVVISTIPDSGVDVVMVGAQATGFTIIGADGGVSPLCDVGSAQGYIAAGTSGLVRSPSFLTTLDMPFAVSIGTGTQRRLSVGQPFGTCASVNLPPTNQNVTNPLMASGADISLASAESSAVITWTANPPSISAAGVVMIPSMLGTLTDLFPGPMGTGSNGVWVQAQSLSSGGPGGSGVLAASGIVWYPISGAGLLGLRAVDVNSGSSSPVIQLATSGTASVALGQGGAVLVAADTGVLTVVENGRIVWATPADARLGGRFASRLMLDCTRDGSGTPVAGRPGVAYLVGAPQQVHAVITDSRGLDVTQPWPMNGHDPRGTSNTGTPLAPFACP